MIQIVYMTNHLLGFISVLYAIFRSKKRMDATRLYVNVVSNIRVHKTSSTDKRLCDLGYAMCYVCRKDIRKGKQKLRL